jgi:hypothetical protein
MANDFGSGKAGNYNQNYPDSNSQVPSKPAPAPPTQQPAKPGPNRWDGARPTGGGVLK